jgi:hypothetical protein
MAITTNGTLASVTGTALTSLTLAATSVIGDLRAFHAKVNSATVSVTGLSGGNVTTWTRVAGPTTDTSGVPATHDLWIGVCTSAGTTAITVTWSASVTGLGTDFVCQTFTNSNTATTWARDGSALALLNNASSTTVTYPTGTAAGTGELYFGHGRCASGGSYSQPTGGTEVTDANGNPTIWLLNAGSGSVAPTHTSTATLSYTVGVLVIATVPGGAATYMPRRGRPASMSQAVNRTNTY